MARTNGSTSSRTAQASLLTSEAGPVALYARVSSEDQAERQTIQAQVEFLRRFCALYHLPVAGEYLDDGISGAIPLAERPEGRRLLADARDGRFGAVLVYRVDRLARKLAVLLDAFETFEALGVALRSATEPIDTATPVGRFVFHLLGSLSELEKATITERMTLGRDRVARSGQWITGRIPYGYDVDAERRLVPSQRPTPLGTEADVARSVFARIASGSSLVAEARRLTLAGVPAVMRYANGREHVNPRGWQQSRLGNMLHNPGYATGVFTVASRHGAVDVPAPALVPLDLWRRAHEQLRVNQAMATRNGKRPYLLRGLIRCGGCGRLFSGGTVTSKGRTYRYYRCTGALPGTEAVPERRCKAPHLAADWIEQTVWDDIRRFVADPGPALTEAQVQARERLARTSDLETERKRLLARLAELDRGQDTILELVRRGRISLAEAEKHLEAAASERAQVQAELDALRAQSDLAAAVEAQIADAAAMLGRLSERMSAIEAAGPEAMRPVVEQLVRRITVHWEPRVRPRTVTRPAVVIEYVFDAPGDVVSDSNQYGHAYEAQFETVPLVVARAVTAGDVASASA